MKKLPKIYQGDFSKKITNNKKYCFLENKQEKEQLISPETNEENISQEINATINKIFNGFGYSYTIPVIIKTKNKTYETFLISKTTDKIVTIENELININEIVSLQTKKNV